MTKHINPFYTLVEATAVLKNLGADPRRSKPQNVTGVSYPFPWGYSYGAKPEEKVYWQEHIISVATRRVYDEHQDYWFEVEIHIDKEGLEALVALTGLNILKGPHSDDYEQWTVNPGTLFKVFALVPTEREAAKS